ncbi:cellulase family glycosylhydrolase [Bacteroides caecigallinarum]|uniref:cellulase family glycosylhydrolase n=1 Tax=Bacteroides caecigallinarum TaxID=1411144 RepID=UPI0019560AB9|nr:cellulase family glycosylhydrolase [Bacteroides caecigallinarum]MBM6890365.1 cellulase family glycosylhydrolase [Bacteroides caecigallinarum]
MKRLFINLFYLIAILINVSFASCTEKEQTEEPFIKVSKETFSFSNDESEALLYIQSNIDYSIASDKQWCSVTQQESTSTQTEKYQIKVSENNEVENRTATITINSSLQNLQIIVEQTAGHGLIVKEKSYQVKSQGGKFTVELSANGEYSYSIDNSWITETTDSKSRAMKDYTIDFNVSANHGQERIGNITFTLGNISETVTVTQEKGEAATVSGETPWDICASLGLGWNLGNQLDAHNNGIAEETAWGNQPTTQALFDQLAFTGFTSVRIPVTWLGHIGEAPSYTIDAEYLNRVAEVVGYAESAGLNAIINIHHDGADSNYWLNIKDAAKDETLNTSIKEQITAIWTQIANKFKDKGNFLVFESMNEIHDGGWGWGENLTDGGKQYAVLNEWNQVFVDAVRATGGNNTNRYLGVPGYVTNIDLTVEHFVLPKDIVNNRLMVAVHFYSPNEFTLNDEYSEWGHTGDSSKKPNWGDEEYLKSQLNRMKTKFIDNGIPAYIGEIGCVHRSNERSEAFRLYYLEYLCKAAKEYGMAPFYWDNGSASAGKECSGLFNHATGEILNNALEVIEVMKRGIFDNSESYTLEHVYENAPL